MARFFKSFNMFIHYPQSLTDMIENTYYAYLPSIDSPKKVNGKRVETDWVLNSMFSFKQGEAGRKDELVYTIELENNDSEPKLDFDMFCVFTINKYRNGYSWMDLQFNENSENFFIHHGQVLKDLIYGYGAYFPYDKLVEKVKVKKNDFFEIRVKIFPFDSLVNIESMALKPKAGRKTLFKTMKGADITIKTKDGKELKAHRSIVSEKSEILAEMLAGKTKNTKKIKIDCIKINYNAKDVQEFLSFIYTFEHKYDDCFTLYRMAKQFEVKELMDVTLYWIYHNINRESVGKTAKFGDEFDLKDLLNCCALYMKANQNTLSKTDAWKKLNPRMKTKMRDLMTEVAGWDKEEDQETVYIKTGMNFGVLKRYQEIMNDGK